MAETTSISSNGTPPEVPETPQVTPPPPLTREEVKQMLDDTLSGITALIRSQNPPALAALAPNELDVLAEEMEVEYGMEKGKGKSLVDKISKIASHTTKGATQELDQFKLRDKFAQVFAAHQDDADKVAPKMAEVFKKLSPLEQNFVLNSPDGAQFIYDKASREMGLYAMTPAQRAAVNVSTGRALTPERKLGGNAELFKKANEAIAKGDRTTYEEIMGQIVRG